MIFTVGFCFLIFLQVNTEAVESQDCVKHDTSNLILIQEKTESSWSKKCVGTLITPVWVLTTAKCLIGQNKTFRCVANTSNVEPLDADAQIRNVVRVIPHEKYSIHVASGEETDNVGLVEVYGGFKLGRNVELVRLPPTTAALKEALEFCEEAQIVTYGLLQTNSSREEHQKISCLYLQITAEIVCNESFPLFPKTKSIFCGFIIETVEEDDKCCVEAGSPIVCHKMMIGIVQNNQCGCTGRVNYYVKIAPYMKYIENAINGCRRNAVDAAVLLLSLVILYKFLK